MKNKLYSSDVRERLFKSKANIRLLINSWKKPINQRKRKLSDKHVILSMLFYLRVSIKFAKRLMKFGDLKGLESFSEAELLSLLQNKECTKVGEWDLISFDELVGMSVLEICRHLMRTGERWYDESPETYEEFSARLIKAREGRLNSFLTNDSENRLNLLRNLIYSFNLCEQLYSDLSKESFYINHPVYNDESNAGDMVYYSLARMALNSNPRLKTKIGKLDYYEGVPLYKSYLTKSEINKMYNSIEPMVFNWLVTEINDEFPKMRILDNRLHLVEVSKIVNLLQVASVSKEV